MKRIFSFSALLLFVLLAPFSLCGCQYSVNVVDRDTQTEGTEELLSDEEETDYAMNDGTVIDSGIIVDADGVVVRLLGIHNTITNPILDLVFDKGNHEYIDFIVDYVKVDGWQVSGMVFPQESGALAIQSYSRYYSRFSAVFNISTDPLVECGLLDQIHEIEFGYQLTGTVKEGIIAEGVYSITTSNDGEPIGFTCDGPILLESDGIKIQIYSFKDGTYQDESCEDLVLYVENDSNQRIEIVLDDAEKYDENSPDEEEEKSEESNIVITRDEKNGKKVTAVPIDVDGNVCAGARTLSRIQTANMEDATILMEGETLSFSIKVYEYEKYNSDDLPDPMLERTVTLTREDMFTPN